MTVEADEPQVRQFIEIISAHVVELAKNAVRPGVLQLCCLSPVDEKMIPHRFRLDDVEGMVKTAVEAAKAGLNCYIETRTMRADLRGRKRGAIEDTEFVFALVVDSDADKGKGGVIATQPSLTIETSPGNHHYWYLLTELLSAARAATIGDAMRASTGADSDTGVVAQCYRIPGTPNYPNRAKQARGRTTVEPTRLVAPVNGGKSADELLAAFASAKAPAGANAVAFTGGGEGASPDDEATLPADLLKDIVEGGIGRGQDKSGSGLWHDVIRRLKRRRWPVERIWGCSRSIRTGSPPNIRAGSGRRSSAPITRSLRPRPPL